MHCEAITFVTGDATAPRGKQQKIIAFVVNDKTPNWGAGFAKVIGRKWPHIQEQFREWSETHQLSLGSVGFFNVRDDLIAAPMIAQHGYGNSPKPRIRYSALQECLEKLAKEALGHSATVHMPAIGCGEAGGSWSVVSELVKEAVCDQSVPVTVYQLPRTSPFEPVREPQLTFL